MRQEESHQAEKALESAVRENRSTFERLVQRSVRSLQAGRDQEAAVQAQIAASYAFFHHAGIWASPTLEWILATIGRRRMPAVEPGRAFGGDRQRVLHVMTRVAAIGGHSRMAWRWLEDDHDREHSVVLTRQGVLPVPGALSDVVDRRSGTVTLLNRHRGNVLTWAQQLRSLAATFDVVIMHIFAEDVIPLIAFANREGLPPIVFVDQADHAFSLGAASADLYVSLRDAGTDLAIRRRWVPPERTCSLPIKVADLKRTMTRSDAKRALRYEPSDVLIVSIARAPKYRTFRGQNFARQFLPLLEQYPQARMLLVGPEIDNEWRDVVAASGDRIEVVGETPSTAIYYEAADVYLDSFPVISNTSLLEAGLYEMPLVSRCVQPGPHTVFCADAPGFAPLIVRVSDPEALVESIGPLLTDAEHRIDLGRQTRSSIVATHVGAGWMACLEALYAHAHNVDPRGPRERHADEFAIEQSDLLWEELFGNELPLPEIESWFVKGFPPTPRIRSAFDISRAQRRIRPELLLPEWITAGVKASAARFRWH